MAARKIFGCRFYELNRASFHSHCSSDLPARSAGVLDRYNHHRPESFTSSGEERFFRRILHRRDILKRGDSSGSDGKSFFRRFLQRRAVFQSAISPDLFSLPKGDKLIQKLRGLNGDRLRLEDLSPPALVSSPEERISVDDVKKLLQFAQLESLKSALKHSPKNCVSYTEFVQIIGECVKESSTDHAMKLAKLLDDSGNVIVLGNVVFLHPEQVTKAIETLVPVSVALPNDPRRQELEKMEKEKVEIDGKAETLVRRELWCGLGFVIAQTAYFMRLTFWELSWDVMEPICFFVASIYFMAGYAFFLRTSREPSFEGFYASRFSSKQKHLMKSKDFNIERFNQLRKACYPSSTFSSSPSSSPSNFDSDTRTILGAL